MSRDERRAVLAQQYQQRGLERAQLTDPTANYELTPDDWRLIEADLDENPSAGTGGGGGGAASLSPEQLAREANWRSQGMLVMDELGNVVVRDAPSGGGGAGAGGSAAGGQGAGAGGQGATGGTGAAAAGVRSLTAGGTSGAAAEGDHQQPLSPDRLDLHNLAKALYDQLRSQLRREFLIDRERAGLLTDFR